MSPWHPLAEGPPEPVSPAALQRGARYGALLSLLFAGFNLASRWFLPEGANLAAYDLFLALNVPAQIFGAIVYASISRAEGGLAEAGGRIAVGLTVTAASVQMGSWLVGGPSAGLNLIFAVILVGFVRLYLTRRHGVLVLASTMLSDWLFAGLRLAGVLDAGTALPSPELGGSVGLVLLAIGWRSILLVVMYFCADYSANRFRASEHAVRELNAGLERKVAEQVAALSRAARLRRYLSPQVADQVLGAAEDPVESRDRRPVTVMFADLRGFTGLVERLAPDALADTLNLYFDEVARVAFRHGGTIDKFIGDSVMIFFGAPQATGAEDQARRCVRVAMEVQARIHQLAREFERLTGAPAEVRIGVASGVATVGGFGSSHRTDFTVVGAPVNRAARLEPLAVPGSVLIDEETQALLGDGFRAERLADVVLKGFTRPQAVYRVSVG